MILNLQQENQRLKDDNDRLRAEHEQCKTDPNIDLLLDLIREDIEWKEAHIKELHSERMPKIVSAYRALRPVEGGGKKIE